MKNKTWMLYVFCICLFLCVSLLSLVNVYDISWIAFGWKTSGFVGFLCLSLCFSQFITNCKKTQFLQKLSYFINSVNGTNFNDCSDGQDAELSASYRERENKSQASLLFEISPFLKERERNQNDAEFQ